MRTVDPAPPPADAGQAGDGQDEETPAARRPLRLAERLSLTLPGTWGALVFVCLSLTPSLLPRTWLIQGVVSGVNAAIGYGLGNAAAYGWRAFADRDARRPTPASWRVAMISVVVAWGVGLLLGRVWQQQLRGLMGAEGEPLWRTLLSPLLAVLVFLLLLAAARAVRGAYRRLTALLSRRIGPRAARTLGWLIVSVGTFLLVSGVLVDGLIDAADRAFSVRDRSTAEGIEQPTSDLRSGGPGSLAAWDSLGRQGRTFTASGPMAADISAFTGDDALDPIRIYAGIATAEDIEDRARLVIDDLERAGGFDRAHLLITTTTGTGWLDPGAMASFEYIAGGDSAILALQYSYLPSWISLLVDQSRAREAGRGLFDAAYERWVALPADDRPRLYVFGESLGSFGAEAAFSGEFDLRNRTDGAIFVGPPGFLNPLHQEFTNGRETGSTQVEPVYRSGRTVRFTTEIGAGAAPQDMPWEGTRVLYLQHPSDPIVWWGPSLLLSRPDWLREERGRDVLDRMTWFPFVTFWQVAADMPFAIDVPDGHGHRYTQESVDAWATVLQPPGWTAEDADRLRALIRE